jgi:NitT/TauT family transport system ATP-binding protein
MEALIEVKGISKAYANYSTGKELVVLRDVNLKIRENEFVCLLGPSGCGKTTLLKILDAMITPDRGEVLFEGKPLAENVDDIGFVFQDVGLLAWRNVLNNVALGLEARGMRRAERMKIALEYTKRVGLDGFAKYFPHQLSGGMQQRVGLARALAISPKVLLMDEPFGAVDAMTRHTLQVELARIWEQNRVTVVFVTHDVDEAIFLSDRIVVMGRAQVAQSVDVTLPRPRWNKNAQTEPEYVALRTELIRLLDKAFTGTEVSGNGR